MRILITRPETQAEAFATQLRQEGFHDLILDPLLFIQSIPTAVLRFEGIDALIITSQNAIHTLIQQQAPRDLPVFAVGEASAEQLQKAGFKEIIVGTGDGEDLFGPIQNFSQGRKKRFLHPAGLFMKESLQTLMRRAGHDYCAVPVYRAEAQKTLSQATAVAISDKVRTVVTFFSPRTAEIFAKLVVPSMMAQEAIRFCSLSLEVAERLQGFSVKSSVVSSEPTVRAMIEAIKTIK